MVYLRIQYLFLPILAFILFSCTDQHADSIITKAEQLLNTKPDSALAVLDDIRESKEDWPRSQQMRYELVYAQAQNKAFVNFTTDSIVLSLVDYYGRHGNANEQMMANYMAGCAYRDLEDALSALKYLNLAVDAVDESDEDCDLSTLMRVYSQMGGLYQRVAAFESERIADSHAERLAWQICDTLSALRLMRLRASTLYDAHQPLQSLMILDSIIQFCNKHGLPEQTKIIYPMRIKYHIETNNALSADSLLREYEQKMNIQPLTPDEKIIDITHFYRKGLYYNLIEQPDSAIMMFQKLIRLINIRSLYTVGKYDLREGAFKGLSEAYSYKHQADSVIKYANLYCQWNDSSIRARASEHLLRFQSLYNYTKIQEQALKAEQRASHLRVTMILLMFFVITIAFVAWSIYKKRLKVERQKQIDTNKEYQLLLHEIEKSAEELQLVKTDSERFLKEKESEIHSLQKSLSLYQGNSLNLEQWEDEREFLSCDLVNHFHDMSSRTQMATATELDKLLDVAQKAFPKLYSTVTDSSHGLSHTEIIICVLIRFRFIPSEISILLGHSSQRITNLKSSINQKLFGTSGAKTLDAHLIALK